MNRNAGEENAREKLEDAPVSANQTNHHRHPTQVASQLEACTS